MTQFTQPFARSQEIFLNYINEIQDKKLGQISVRRAIKKYDVKNLKINNVTPLRAKKMYSTITSKYSHGITTDKSWLENERRLFIWCTLCYLYKNELEIQDLRIEDFQFLKQMFPLKEINLIKFQIYSLVKKNNKNEGWKGEEDQLLIKLVKQLILDGRKQNEKNIQWSNISKQFFVKSQEKFFRNTKQCRQRWLNYLDPNKKKGKWEKQQDIILLKEVLEKGKKWSKIVESLEGKKNQHMIKNRYKSLIHKKQKACKNSKLSENVVIEMILKEYEANKEQSSEQDHQESEECSKEEQQEQVGGKYQQNGELEYEEKESEKNEEFIKQQHNESKNNNFYKRCQNWPIIVQPKNKEFEKQKTLEDQKCLGNSKELEILGCKADKQFVNNLFFSVSTPLPEDNRFFPGIFQNRSPAAQGHFLTSPFPACWTPSIVFEDHQNLQSPHPHQFTDFSSTARNFTNFMERKS